MVGPIEMFLTADHVGIDALLARADKGDGTPTRAICAELRAVLARHNPLEEGSDGLYATCDALAGAEAEQVVERLKSQPQVPMAAHYDGPLVSKHRR